VLGGQVDERAPLVRRQGDPGRVLVVGDHVRELGPDPRLDERAQLLDVDAVLGERDLVHLGAQVAQAEQRAVVGRLLDDHGVVALDQMLEEQGVGLQRAVGHDDLIGLDPVPLRDPGPQRQVADRRAVGGDATRIDLEGTGGRGLQAVDVDDVQAGRPARKRNELHGS
jgi:hypothetical protein